MKKHSRISIEKYANEILKKHGLFSVPVDPVILANKEGIIVNNAKFSEESISGMVAKRGIKTIFLINQSEHPYRKRFTIAHELGHHFLHLENDGDFVDKETDLFRDIPENMNEISDERLKEIQANQFAAALLMPIELVKKEFDVNNDLNDLAIKFNVSKEAMGIRLNRIGLI